MSNREREFQFLPKEVSPGKTPFAFFDIDGTLVKGLTLYAFARYLTSQELINQTELEQMEETLRIYAEERISNEHNAYTRLATNIVDQYAVALKGKSTTVVEAAGNAFFESVLKEEIPDDYALFEYAKDLVLLMKRVGKSIAISGSPIEPLIPLARYLGFDELQATILEQKNGFYTGEIKVNLALDQNKHSMMLSYLRRDVDIPHSFAFGDSTHDRPLLDAVSNPVVLGNNPELIDYGRREGWIVPESPNKIITLVQERIDALFEKR